MSTFDRFRLTSSSGVVLCHGKDKMHETMRSKPDFEYSDAVFEELPLFNGEVTDETSGGFICYLTMEKR